MITITMKKEIMSSSWATVRAIQECEKGWINKTKLKVYLILTKDWVLKARCGRAVEEVH
jgi:hypothetical protein